MLVHFLHDLFVNSNAEFLFSNVYSPLRTTCTKCTAF